MFLEKGLYISDYVEFVERSKQRSRPEKNTPAPANPGRIELDQVSFRYPGGDGHRALRGVSLAIEAGQTIALVGENGSGKTTLAKLIAGLYQPTTGRISWDGDRYPGHCIRQAVADRVVMVQQDPIRWPRSARDNVRLGRHARVDPDAVAFLEAARQSRAQEVIDGLPEGWNTLLSPEFRGGRDLSAGQWQRLAVARGLYRDAPLVIWDEPTAPLDAKAEHAVYESLRLLSRDKTVILITHRLASIRNADRIFYLERGALVEQGRHEELLQMGGRYAELYHLQTRLHGLEGRDRLRLRTETAQPPDSSYVPSSPSCFITLALSNSDHSSRMRPSRIRHNVIPRSSPLRPVAGRPLPSPVLVPVPVHNTQTLSPSATIWSTCITRSGNACFHPRAAAWSSARPMSWCKPVVDEVRRVDRFGREIPVVEDLNEHPPRHRLVRLLHRTRSGRTRQQYQHQRHRDALHDRLLRDVCC